MSLIAPAAPALAGPCPQIVSDFDAMRAPLLPTGWVASQGVNVTGAPLWVTTRVTPGTAPNDAFSTAPDNILDNRLDTPVLGGGPPFFVRVFFENNYNLQSGADGAVLEVSHPTINGGAFTDITDPAVGGSVTPGYNALITSASSPLAGRMAWTGNSGGYVSTVAALGNAFPPSGGCKVRFRLVTDNSGASAGWRIDNVATSPFECFATPTPSAAPTATPIASPCGSPNVIADSTFEAGTPWSNWTVQTSTNFSTSLCNRAVCGSQGGSPYGGDNWAWFGGANVPETATLGQSVPIMAGGTATLTFAMQITAFHTPPNTDVLNVRVDGAIVQSYSEGGFEGAYSLRTCDLSAFADGGSHLILFEYVAPTTDTSTYLVDNVFLTFGPACSSPTPTPTPGPTPTATATATPTATIFPTATPTPSDCPGGGCTPSIPPSPTVTATPTATPTLTATPPPTPTPSSTATATPPPTPTPSPTTAPPLAAQPLNISTRLRVETGDRVIIGGFIITGNVPKKVAIRGVGPSLATSGLSDVLADPTLQLFDSDSSLMQNDDWQDDPAQAAQLAALGLALPNTKESGIVATLPPGNYTVLVAGKNQTTGIGLVEIYDADPGAASQLANISTRGFVRTGDNVMIGGFILGNGTGSANIIVRALGPSLSHFMLPDFVADPTLELRDANGALLIANDDWQDDPASAAQLIAYGLQPSDPVESGIFASLAPGAFTAIVAGKNGDVGSALVEVYNVHPRVTTTADSGPGSLRDAIAGASDGDTIQFDTALQDQVINLTSGALVIDKSITISGFLFNRVTVQRNLGSPSFRIFDVMPACTVTIEGLTIRGGGGFPNFSVGGGVLSSNATLTLSHCAVENNQSIAGGGIFSSGASARLTVVNSSVNNNSVSGGQAEGGGINSTGVLTITNSTVSGNNSVTTGGRAGGIFSNGTLTITNSTIRGNSGGGEGGGILCGGSATITNSTIEGNTSTGTGGGIKNSATLTLTNSTISGNTASSNQSGRGGGIFNDFSSTLTIAHSTFSGNSADGTGGGINLGSGTLHIGNTVLKAGSSGANLVNTSGAVISQGYNLSSDNGGGFLNATGDRINTQPMLGPLQNNSGPTFTHALLSGSPAIDAGDPNFTPPPSSDQRGPGYPRVIGGRIDIGSFEFRP
jgi:hypothetical protein